MASIVDVSERKIRPIYGKIYYYYYYCLSIIIRKLSTIHFIFLLEAIEISNYKSALSQCNKLLKKQPEALILKVLI